MLDRNYARKMTIIQSAITAGITALGVAVAVASLWLTSGRATNSPVVNNYIVFPTPGVAAMANELEQALKETP